METLTEVFKNNTLLGLFIALFGGIAIRWLDRSLREQTDTFVQAQRIRTELRLESDTLRNTMKDLDIHVRILESELDVWKEKYFNLLEVGSKRSDIIMSGSTT